MNKLLTIFVLLFALVGCNDIDEGVVDLGPGDMMPEFSVVMSDNSTVSNETLSGKICLIVFFHTECPDCQQELPVIQKIYEEYGNKVEFVAVGTGQDADRIEAFWLSHKLTLPYSVQPDRSVLYLFAPGIIPHVFIIDKTGKIRFVYTDNPIASYDILKQSINSIL